MTIVQKDVKITRWRGSEHPTFSNITRQMKKEGLRPYMWTNMANQRYGVRSHGYDKVLYVVDGSIEVSFPDLGQQLVMRPGDRVDVPAGVRHGTIVGNKGACCVEAAVARR
jgi:mannose-6-phosphate isomerase-like protein (cupin superfamily)